ncbi:Protein rof [Pseudomonas sp. 8Z]|uniref:Rho-binding antiterminator n=1 Tax=Pseudomonas sp. 8Z TaxID=2653166 RepID=UPI0012F0C79B|nr:Rho-binding antiterminator [Pseudomonas sp. 8Z]VXC40938.1 Protein rof [Pseudomonas sp. 8Z]
MDHPYQPLACNLYDYLEIACMRRYRLLIELTDGSNLEGQALTTETTANKEEYLHVLNASGTQRLRLDHLVAISALDERASFDRVLLNHHNC